MNMKRIKKDELYRHVDGFLKTKGVELKPGSYTDRIQRVCGLLSDVINTSQSGLERAKEETEKGLEKVRQVIHEKTAPKPPPTQTPPPTSAPPPNPPNPNPPRAKRAPKTSVKKPARRPAASKQRGK
jgi:hypothetical protein